MPKKRIPKTKLGRTHLHQKTYWLKDNYNKCLILTNDVIAQRYEITNGQIGFLLLVYDLQFFYIPYIAKLLSSEGVTRTSHWGKYVKPLISKGYISEVEFGSNDEEYFLFNSNVERRHMITARGRQLVQDYYNVLQSLNDKYGVGVTPPQ
jgi:hypothetical protein